VIVHLIPFLLTSRAKLLTLLAFVGVIVNACLVLLALPEKSHELLLTVGASSGVLLGATIIIPDLMKKKTSMLELLLSACRERMLITCSTYDKDIV